MSSVARQLSSLELRAQLSLALPIFGGQLAQSANGFVDTVMAGRVSALDLAAVAVGASIWVPVFLFMTGMLMSATSVLARHVGAKQLQPLGAPSGDDCRGGGRDRCGTAL
jgi:MATE family multidrug resistance protein